MATVEALLRLSNGAALHKALREVGVGVSYRTVARWVGAKPASKPPSDLLPALEAVFGVHKEAAPSEEGAAAELLRLWTGPEPPPWAVGLTRQLMELIHADRETTVEQAIQSALDRAEAEVLLRRPRAARARSTSGRAPSNTAGQAGRRP